MINIYWIIVAFIAVVAAWVLVAYNGLIRRRNQVREAWSDIDVQLKRRHNLIPNLVKTVKGYATHENTTFEKITNARANALNAKTPAESAKAENMLSATLKTLFAVSENYPELKANVNFLELQRELSDTENKVQAARRFFNGNVRDLNTNLQSVPTNIIARFFNFKPEQFFELSSDEEKKVPSVDFKN